MAETGVSTPISGATTIANATTTGAVFSPAGAVDDLLVAVLAHDTQLIGQSLILYDAETAPFTAGLVLTGTTSGATANLLKVVDDGTTGTLHLADIVGTFLDNEPLTDTGSGAALANGVVAGGGFLTQLGLPSTGTDIGWTEIGSNIFTGLDNSGLFMYYLKEDQGPARSWDFGTLSAVDNITAKIFRISGQDLTTAIDTSETRQTESVINRVGIGIPFTITKPGAMSIWLASSDTNSKPYSSPPVGFTEEWNNIGQSGARISLTWRKWREESHPYPHQVDSLAPESSIASAVNFAAFVINPVVTPRVLTGVTKDKDGGVLVSAQVVLMKDLGGGVYVFVGTVVSNATTGVYIFNIDNDDDANFVVFLQKPDTPHVFGITDNVLVPV